ncbi:hypothetical protein [Pseudomonas donghuensis]|uniref:hypothetical protein n=1 Tax=Pseudomonas donghuensis TaxID=1163398 RepID=UPI0020C3B6C0|nr:hypothetical protein [Pseudomonas donghuensis]MCP6699355.1 hypothetical protein [Pseudomonas donghuensis]
MIVAEGMHPVWLVSEYQIGFAIYDAVRDVREMYRENFSSMGMPDANHQVKEFFQQSSVSFMTMTKEQANQLVECCCVGTRLRFSDVDPGFAACTSRRNQSVANFFKIVFLRLWSQRKVILPVLMRNPQHMGKLAEFACEEVPSLALLKSVESKDTFYAGKQKVKNDTRKGNHWRRLLLSTNIYSSEDLTYELCYEIVLKSCARGAPLAKFCAVEFLLIMCAGRLIKIELVERAAADARAQQKKKRMAESPIYLTKSALAVRQVVAYSHGELGSNGAVITPDVLIQTIVTPVLLKPVFDMEVAREGKKCELYAQLPTVVRNFCRSFDGAFRSFIKSKRLQSPKADTFVLNVILSYLAAYLPNFLMSRDGSLANYPKDLDALSCPLYFTREYTFVEGFNSFKLEPPMSILKYLERFARIYNWSQETHYARVLVIDDFASYVVTNRSVIAGAGQFVNSFTAACYPRIQRSAGTVKRPIPRSYFGAFLSILYSLEYLVTHLNGMAQGKIPGVHNGELYNPGLFELREMSAWDSIWGKAGKPFSVLDLSVLSYCPIFYHEKKIFPFEFIPRFYRISTYEIEGNLVERVVPNHVRVTQLMCETGLRQHHLIWLDKERYDLAFDRSTKMPLAPLFVSSDKSHDKWTAIVGRHVFDILDRHRDWYDRCTSADYQKEMWYGGTEGAKFGMYKPLFRLPSETPTGWANYKFFPIFLTIIQYFIVHQMGDDSIPDLVYIKGAKGKASRPVEFTPDFISSIAIESIGSKYTPHGLRAGFITEAIRVLPPDLIGGVMTGQTEELVWYYTVLEGEDMPDHQQLLANLLAKNISKLEAGLAPELAEAVINLNARLMSAIEADPVKAIETHGLMSLLGVKEGKNGIEVLRGRKHTSLSFMPTHICPFGSKCPKEVIEQYGAGQPCSYCEFAIRGVEHLPAVNAQKDRCKEEMVTIIKKLSHYKNMKPSMVDKEVREKLGQEHDRYAREAFAYEAIEQQLYKMSQNDQASHYFLREKASLVEHYVRVELTEAEHLIKRLVDVQNFPDASSPELDTKFAYLRAILLMQEGDLSELLQIGKRSPGVELASQISSMINSGALDVMDVFRIGQLANNPASPEKPSSVIHHRIGFSSQEDKSIGEDKGYIRCLPADAEETET